MLNAIGRYGPLVAAFVVGLGGLLAAVAPGAAPIAGAFVAFLGFFGAQPDAALVSEIGAVISSALLVYGSVRKIINLVKGA